MLNSTSKFQVVEIVYNRQGFALARGYWEGDTSVLRHACRWHEDGGIGYPQTFGKPQWMLLPNEAHYERVETIEPLLPAHNSRVTITFTNS